MDESTPKVGDSFNIFPQDNGNNQDRVPPLYGRVVDVKEDLTKYYISVIFEGHDRIHRFSQDKEYYD